jgi:hypothetical protein
VTARAEGAFAVKSWDEKTYEQLAGKAKLTHARIEQEFSGDLQARGTWEALMSYAPDGTATFVGLIRIVGSLGGRAGSAVLQTLGRFDGSVARWSWEVTKDSGTDALAGLAGRGELEAPHGSTGTYRLEYTME